MVFGFGDPLARRRAQAARSASGVLADFYRADVPGPSTPLDELPLLALDCETTGLDADRDALLSIGFVPVDGPTITFAGARSILIAGTDVGQSATIHGLTDDALAGGLPEPDAVAAALQALTGRVLLAHYAQLEIDFLSRACRRHFGAPLVVPVVDTMRLAWRIVAPGFDAEPRRDELRLWNARRRYGLPRYAAHQAATDALACAELYLAQAVELRLTTLKSASGT